MPMEFAGEKSTREKIDREKVTSERIASGRAGVHIGCKQVLRLRCGEKREALALLVRAAICSPL